MNNFIEALSSEIAMALEGATPRQYPAWDPWIRRTITNAETDFECRRRTIFDLLRSARVQPPGWGWVKCEPDQMPPLGVAVLAYIPCFRDGVKDRRIRAQYAPPKTMEADASGKGDLEYDEATDTHYFVSGWFEDNEYEAIHWRVTDVVTHWMPLPEGPS